MYIDRGLAFLSRSRVYGNATTGFVIDPPEIVRVGIGDLITGVEVVRDALSQERVGYGDKILPQDSTADSSIALALIYVLPKLHRRSSDFARMVHTIFKPGKPPTTHSAPASRPEELKLLRRLEVHRQEQSTATTATGSMKVAVSRVTERVRTPMGEPAPGST